MNRRDFVKLLGVGGAVFASACAGVKPRPEEEDFFFVQLSDTHWGYTGPANPDAANTLRQAVAAVNALPRQPDFVVFTGDLTHTTDDAAVRNQRMGEFKEIVAGLTTRTQRYLPGE
ncbi:MAG: metallophosphoesterase, partial [Myxococcales bacterium]